MTPTNDQVIIDKKKLYGTILTAIIGSAVVTAFALLRIANSDHFTLIALGQRVDSIEAVFVPRNEFELVCQRLDRIEQKLDSLLLK
jgi:hypothetical protein